MKTPLMEWIEKLKVQVSDKSECYTTLEINVMYDVIRHATKLLEKEREVIEEAYNEGFLNCPHSTYIGKVITASDYYTKTFTNGSK